MQSGAELSERDRNQSVNEVTNLGDVAQCSAASSDIALIDLSGNRERSFSFADIEAAANAVAFDLSHRRLPRQSAIGILGKNSYEYLVHYLGVLKAGMVVVPFNYKLPEEALEYVIADAEVSLVFTDPATADRLPNPVTQVPLGDGVRLPTGVEANPPGPSKANGGRNAALILYTSGSTGRPKGVVLSHQSQLTAVQALYPMRALVGGRSTIVAAPLFHMNALTFCHLMLAAGGKIVLMPSFEVTSYINAIEAHDVAVVSGVPTMISLIAREAAARGIASFAGVRLVAIGSAPLTEALLQEIKTLFPNAAVSNSYGTTEIGPSVFGAHPDGLKRPSMSIGYPSAESQVRLVDGSENEGVLEVRGPGLMSAYKGLPDLTADRLKSGFYNTGDIMRRDENGFYYFVGRADDMFVCSGENIYPREVEKLVEDHPDIVEVCVVPIDDPVRGQIPIAFAVLRPGAEAGEQGVKDFALKHGPPHLHPRRVLFLNAMPLAGTNKIDRAALIAKARSDTAGD